MHYYLLNKTNYLPKTLNFLSITIEPCRGKWHIDFLNNLGITKTRLIPEVLPPLPSSLSNTEC